MSEHLQFFDDITEIYMLDNLCWRIPIEEKGEYWGQYKIMSQKNIKKLDPDGTMFPGPGTTPVVREYCPKCVDGGTMMEDGFMPCFYCCQVGFVYTPLDDYIMERTHLDALEDDYQRDMRIEQSKRGVLAGLDMAVGALNKVLNPQPEVEDDIPF